MIHHPMDKIYFVPFLSEITQDVLSQVGETEVKIQIGKKEYTSTMKIVDTTAPVAQTVDVSIYQNQEVKPEMFVKDIKDESEVKVSFKEEVSTKEIGQFDVIVNLTDAYDNATSLECKLNVKKDDVAPVIEGVKNITVVKGKTVSYKKGVTVSDNCDKNIQLNIDTSKVKLDQVGTYEVVYSATDSSNNKTEKKINVQVINENTTAYTLENVYAQADKVLNKIIKPSMSKREKCRQIYNWVHANIGYINDSDKSSWIKGAMVGFTKKRGDCYNYFAVTKALLTRAGIENIDLKATKHTHFWNFVKVEEGWYHLDTTPRKDRPNLFLRTDAWMDSYSVKHSHCFSYDPASKPPSATK